jgi:hypothetical protein
MISLDWKERLVRDSIDFFERKLPEFDYDFDIIYNAYPSRKDNKIPQEVIVLVANTLAAKMVKNHSEYIHFCDYIWHSKGTNGKIAFACIISKFIKKDYVFYSDYTKKFIEKTTDIAIINLLIDKIYLPIFKKQPIENIDNIINWLQEGNDTLRLQLIKMVFKIGKQSSFFIKKLTDKLESKWKDATPEFVKTCSLYLKNLAKHDYELYLTIYKSYVNSREPVFVEILTLGLTTYEDFIFYMYENWAKSGNARLKKAALSGQKYLKRKNTKDVKLYYP